MPKWSPVRPNEGIRTAYQRQLEALIDQMDRGVSKVLLASYKDAPPVLASDASPARTLQATMRRLGKYWLGKFDELAPRLASHYAKSVADRTDRQMKDMLREGHFTVRFKLTDAQNDVLQSIIGENITLIKSLASENLTQIEGLVMRSVAAGRDMASLAKGLQDRHAVTRRRAAFIARDQSNKATAMLERVRMLELGITKARWLHSAGGHTPRPTHVAFSGHIYDIRKGVVLEPSEGIVWPGTAINCRCVSQPIVPGFDD